MRYLFTIALILGVGVFLLYKLEDFRTSSALDALEKTFSKYQMARLRKQMGVYLQDQGSSAVSPLMRTTQNRRQGLDRRLMAQALLCRLAEGPWLKGASRGTCLRGCFETLAVPYRDQDEVGLLERLKGEDPGAARYAATGFQKKPSWIQSEVKAALKVALSSPYLPLRIAAIEALAEVQDDSIVKPAQELQGIDPRLTTRVLAALGKLDSSQAEAVLLKAYEKHPVRALKALAGKRGSWTSQLSPSLEDRDPRVRAYAARAFAESGSPKGLSALVEGLREGGEESRLEFLRASVGFSNPALLPVLVALASDKNPKIRAATAQVLVPWRDPLAQATVNTMLVDKDSSVVLEVVRVIAEIADVRDGEKLARFLDVTSGPVLRHTFRGMTRMRDFRALEAMRRCTENRSAITDPEELILAEHGIAVLEGRVEETDPPDVESQVILRMIEG